MHFEKSQSEYCYAEIPISSSLHYVFDFELHTLKTRHSSTALDIAYMCSLCRHQKLNLREDYCSSADWHTKQTLE